MPSPRNERIMRQAADYMAAVENAKAERTTPMPDVTQRDREELEPELQQIVDDVCGKFRAEMEAIVARHSPRHRTADTARIDELEKLLERYGKHDGLCAIVGGYGYCTCGFSTALGGQS